MIKNALVLFIVCAVVFVVFLPSYIKMQRMHERNSAYARQIKELTDENAKMVEERRRLIEDPEYLERVARKKFGIIKEGETIYKMLPAGVAVTKKAEEPNADDKPKPKAEVKPVVKKVTTSTTKKTSTSKTPVSGAKTKSSTTAVKKTSVKKP